MKLHVLRADLDFHWLQPAGGVMWRHKGGVPVATPWRMPSLVLPADDPADAFLAADCLPMNTGSDGLIISDHARLALADLLTPAGEFWPVDVLGRRYWWYNHCATLAALDLDRTEAEWDSVDGEHGSVRWISAPKRLAFLPARVATAPPVFRLPEFPFGVLFACETTKRTVSRHKLTGFRFDLVWSSTGGGVADPPGFGFEEAWRAVSPRTAERKRAAARAVLQRRSRDQD